MKKSMHVVRREDLPFIGSSYNFAGAKQGDVGISMFFVEAPPGRGAPLHVHEYDEIVLLQEGRSPRLTLPANRRSTRVGSVFGRD